MSPLYYDQTKEKNDKLVPGPGNYEFHSKARKTAPNYGFGTSKRGDQTLGTKNVNTEIKYDPEAGAVKAAAPRFAFGGEKRRMFDDRQGKNVPAPGNYNIRSQAFEDKYRFHMGIKLKDKQTMDVPGSGTYNPTDNFTKRTGAGYSMGLKLKSGPLSQSHQVIPGPGQYDGGTTAHKTKAPQFGFGSSKRPDIVGGKKGTTPGPGDYKVPVRISNVEDFALPGRDPASKHI